MQFRFNLFNRNKAIFIFSKTSLKDKHNQPNKEV